MATESNAIDRFMNCGLIKGDNNCLPNVRYMKSEADLLRITKGGHVHEYEFKMTITGIREDLNKRAGVNYALKHQENIIGNRVNYFSFVIPEKFKQSPLLNRIPKKYGIIFFKEGANRFVFTEYRGAAMLCKRKVSVADLAETIYSAGLKMRLDKKTINFWKQSSLSRLREINVFKNQ